MDIWTAGDREPQLLAFKRTAGLKSVINNKESPLEYFNLFLCDIDFEFLAQQINNYAQQYISSAHLKPHSRFNKCQETNSTEMKKFISLIILMGLVRQLDIKAYWNTDPATATPFFPNVLLRDRFLSLKTFLDLNDNPQYVPRGQDGYDPLFKLGPLFHEIL